MTEERDLFEKTFDQQVEAAGGQIDGLEIAPNRRIQGELVLEPMGPGVRVTARDAEHRVLWGYVASRETVRQVHCLVATYDTFQKLVAEELERRGLYTVEDVDPIQRANDAVAAMSETLEWLREGLNVKKTSDATEDRARIIARIVSDAHRQISLEASTLKGMKSRTKPQSSTELREPH